MPDTEPVGWIGAGKMGLPMLSRLIAAGVPVRVSEPDDAARAAAEQAGARAAHPADLVRDCPVIFATIPNDTVLRSVTLGPEGLAGRLGPHQTLVEMSTVSPAVSRAVAEATRAAYVRAPVSGSTAMAAAGTLTVLASGDPGGYARAEPLLRHLSARQFYVGPAEEARYLKLVLNAMVGATSAVLGEAMALGRRGGLSRDAMLDVLCESAVASPLLKYKRDLVTSGDYTPAFSVAQMMKDFDLILEAARADHIPMAVVALIRQQYEAAFAAGRAEEDFFVLVREMAKLSGIEEP